MFSTSMGVMVYVAKANAVYGDKNSSGQACERGFLSDHDFLCTEMNTEGTNVNTQESAHYQIYNQHKRYHFVTWEEMDTIRPKIKDYINRTDGWAVFHADLDVRRVCGAENSMDRVIALYTAVKTRRVP
ncbi:uncharacterized protein LOC119457029 [Dermacentor silvarum]|uniref:uncharacterized protein LOC119457029 n=1 Tax=Dermacentor silvarum TaxID=543639 RepID=UPI00189B1301|nr:uncharacterized protein LOC119457029 [Dermacentor silvarum]